MCLCRQNQMLIGEIYPLLFNKLSLLDITVLPINKMSDSGTDVNPSPQPLLPAPADLGTAIMTFVLFVLIFLFVVWILQATWNASLPKMFTGAKEITFATAFFFMIVAMIIFPRSYTNVVA